MSLVTQCPQCSTHFKLVPDQLRISDGWVRCGQCGEVFDARERMQPLAPSTRPTDHHSDESVTADNPFPVIDFPPAPDVDSAPASPTDLQFDGVQQQPLGMSAQTVAAGAARSQTESTDAAIEQSDSIQALLRLTGLSTADNLSLEKVSAPNRIRKTKPKPQRKGQFPLAPDDVSFVRQAKRQEFWRRPLVRATLWLMSVFLSLSLVAQVVLQQRDRLVAAYPALRSWAEWACQPIGCEVRQLQQLESVIIDSSAMVRLADGVFRFEVVLKNTSEFMLAVPALELSLTNSRDETVVRRVVLPSDWSAAPEELSPLSELPLSVRITLIDGSELRMAGYRAVVFYP